MAFESYRPLHQRQGLGDCHRVPPDALRVDSERLLSEPMSPYQSGETSSRERPCETCGATVRDDTVFVYALPGIPMSVGNCLECVRHCAYPLDVAEANLDCIGGLEEAAQWWKESITYKDGKYMTMQEAFG